MKIHQIRHQYQSINQSINQRANRLAKTFTVGLISAGLALSPTNVLGKERQRRLEEVVCTGRSGTANDLNPIGAFKDGWFYSARVRSGSVNFDETLSCSGGGYKPFGLHVSGTRRRDSVPAGDTFSGKRT